MFHVNILGCGIFAAVSGSSAATAATIGRMTCQTQKRLQRAYGNWHMAGSGTLGLLIPRLLS
ncbi:TRAP transporter large permease subunit [Marinomonas gallaica]|uniref:TRAP transporter large permease subunit n=1 Tax=Marinomonas gallaica TaxID=1806667 RepID=UPI003A8FBB4A